MLSPVQAVGYHPGASCSTAEIWRLNGAGRGNGAGQEAAQPLSGAARGVPARRGCIAGQGVVTFLAAGEFSRYLSCVFPEIV
jgi:hypothetical protein